MGTAELFTASLTLVTALGPPVSWQAVTRRVESLPSNGPRYSLGLFAVLVLTTAGAVLVAPMTPRIEWGMPTAFDIGLMLLTSPVLWTVGILVGIAARLVGVELSSTSSVSGDSLVGDVAVAIAVGPAEEVAFRGFIQPVLSRVYGLGIGVLGMGILFGLYHYPNSSDRLREIDADGVAEMAISGLGGIVLGGLYLISGNLVVPIVGHSLHVAGLVFLPRVRGS